ncbi:unnamed protein product [Bemisia tabaci]|uniref:Protein farnesyltransferase/geranylgeranyltransferase type-1 subunit alpha n=1 Tax=Bemisia tabaci TaxID=7038 RepID=A0A9P0AGY9_BEMTA|nr:unnamed protein product [Bemisia tabaci]
MSAATEMDDKVSGLRDHSSTEDLSEESVLIRDCPEFRDVEPTPQFEGHAPVASIAYSESFKDAHDYLRSLLKMGELSERALKLTEIALNINAANYTTWKYRRDILRHLGTNTLEEYDYIKMMIPDNAKTYQVWHHCQKILEWIGEPMDILEFIEEVLKQDSKNYHAWQLRQWVLLHFKFSGTAEEIAFVSKMIEDDVRNNSAWNHRYFVIHTLSEFTDAVFSAEIDYTISKIKLATNNESAWNYLRGTLAQKGQGLTHTEVEKLTELLYSRGCRSPQVLMFMADKLREDCEKADASDDIGEKVRLCSELYEVLANKWDKIRCRYWTYLSQEFSAEFGSRIGSNEKTEVAS